MVAFNWNKITRPGLIKALAPIGPSVIGKSVKVSYLQNLLRRYIKQQVPVSVRSDRDPRFPRNFVAVGGQYSNTQDRRRQRSIEIRIWYHPWDSVICLTARRWRRLCCSIADTVMHEIIHMRQFRARNFRYSNDYQSTAALPRQRQEQQYLGNSDEIGAYAFNIACYLHDRFRGDRRRILAYLKQNLGRRSVSCLQDYLKYFDDNHDHPVIRRLKRKIIRYLPYAELGRPFKTTNHLDR